MDLNFIYDIAKFLSILAPICVIFWKLSKADSQIKENEKDIKELQTKSVNMEFNKEKIPLHEQRLETIERDIAEEKKKTTRMEESLSEIREEVKSISSKLDMILTYRKGE